MLSRRTLVQILNFVRSFCNLAYLAVDKDSTEWVWSYCPLRNKYRGVWDAPYNDDDYTNRSIELPKGSIEKLIGRTLTWADEPYEMVE